MTDPDSVFHIKSHQVEASHLRTYRGSARDDNQPFLLHVKQYIPRANTKPKPGDVTLIASGGIGLAKELYEPLFADILQQCNRHNVGLRGIWIADSAPMGQSYALNAHNLGNEVSWWDHSRDLLHLINTFHAEMPRPLIGLGHSMGGAQMAYLSTLHPSLFTSLILIEASIYPRIDRHIYIKAARGMLLRPDTWPNRAVAEKAIRKSPIGKQWDPRAVDRYLRYAITEAHSGSGTAVQTTSNKSLEAAHIWKLNDKGIGLQGAEAISLEDRISLPDVDPDLDNEQAPLHSSPTARWIYKLINQLRPWVLYIDGTEDPASAPEVVRPRLETTGTGVGGSGGMRLGAVKQHIIQGGQHTLVFDQHIGKVAETVGDFVASEMERWRRATAEGPGFEQDGFAGGPRANARLEHVLHNYKEEQKRVWKREGWQAKL